MFLSTTKAPTNKVNKKDEKESWKDMLEVREGRQAGGSLSRCLRGDRVSWKKVWVGGGSSMSSGGARVAVFYELQGGAHDGEGRGGGGGGVRGGGAFSQTLVIGHFPLVLVYPSEPAAPPQPAAPPLHHSTPSELAAPPPPASRAPL